MTDFTEVGTIRRKAQNAGLMRIVEDSIKYAPKTIESIAIDTGSNYKCFKTPIIMSALVKTNSHAIIKAHPATIDAEETLDAFVDILFELALASVSSDLKTQQNEA